MDVVPKHARGGSAHLHAPSTLMLGAYDLYWQWADLSELADLYVEQPFFKDWPFEGGRLFHCNFDNVDAARFPSFQDGELWKAAFLRSGGSQEGTSDSSDKGTA